MFAQIPELIVRPADAFDDRLAFVPSHTFPALEGDEKPDVKLKKQLLYLRVKAILENHKDLAMFRRSAQEIGISLDDFAKFLSGSSGQNFFVYVDSNNEKFDTQKERREAVGEFIEKHIEKLNEALYGSLPILYYKAKENGPDWVGISYNEDNYDNGGSGLTVDTGNATRGYFTLRLGLTDRQVESVPEALAYNNHLFVEGAVFLFQANGQGPMAVEGIEHTDRLPGVVYIKISGKPDIEAGNSNWAWYGEGYLTLDATLKDEPAQRLLDLVEEYANTDAGAMNIFRLLKERINRLYAEFGIDGGFEFTPEIQAAVIGRIQSIKLFRDKTILETDEAAGMSKNTRKNVRRLLIADMHSILHEIFHAASDNTNYGPEKVRQYEKDVEEGLNCGLLNDDSYPNEWGKIHDFVGTLGTEKRKAALDLLVGDWLNLTSYDTPANRTRLIQLQYGIFGAPVEDDG
jgi:hypothetical protein